MRILFLFFCCTAWSISVSAITAYADTTICDTIITRNPIDTILARTIVDIGGSFYYIPCDEPTEKYITLKKINIVDVRYKRRSEARYLQEQSIVLKKLKKMSLFNLLTFGLIIMGILVWYPLILVGLLFVIPLLVVSYSTYQYLNDKYYLVEERALSRKLYAFPFIVFSILAAILYISVFL